MAIGTQEDLCLYAANLGLGIEAANVFAGVEPDSATDPAVTFKTYGAEPNVKVYERRQPALTAPRVQVTVRSQRYSTAQALADGLYQALFQSNTTIGGNGYLLIEPMSEPFPLGPDPNGRQQLGFNLRCRRSN